MHAAALGAPGGRDQRRVEGQAQALGGFEGRGAGLGRVETLHGAGQPDQPLQALDVSAAVVHQLVLRHGSAAAGGGCGCVRGGGLLVQRNNFASVWRACVHGTLRCSPVHLLTPAGWDEDEQHEGEPSHRPAAGLHLLQDKKEKEDVCEGFQSSSSS